MARNRIGLGKGQGKGYKNIIPVKDRKVHQDSKKGIKQPQFKDVDSLLRKNNIQTDIDKIGAETKTQAIIKRSQEQAKKGLLFAQEQLQKLREKQKAKKIKALEEINHPLTKKLQAQEKRVAELKDEIATNPDENTEREEELFNELQKEQNQLRQLQEKATKLNLSTLSDAELKTLAIRHPEDTSFFSGLFGNGDDKYTAELVKRIKKKAEIEKTLNNTRKEVKGINSGSDPVSNFFKDFFKP